MIPCRGAMKKLTWTTIILGLAFAGLLGIRQVRFSDGAWFRAPRLLAPGQSLPERDTWLNIYQNGVKVGYAHSFRTRNPEGYTVGEEVRMRLNTLGTLQSMQMTTRAVLDADFALSDFDFKLVSGAYRFSVQGTYRQGRLVVEINPAGDSRTVTLPLEQPPHLPAGILDAALAAKLQEGSTVVFPVFDPATLGSAPVTITHMGVEAIRIDGIQRDAIHLQMDFKGARQHAWVDDQGNLWRQKGLLGLVMEQTTRTAALETPQAPPADIMAYVSLPVGRTIPEPERLQRLTVALTGVDTRRDALTGERQTLQGNQLTITRETLPANAPEPKTDAHREYLAATPFIQADHPRIRALAAEIALPAQSDRDKVRRIMAWINANITQRPVISLPDAVATLENGVGDCNEHAVLLAALCRAAGIPARVEAGLVYQAGRFYYHAWNRLFLGAWITADAVFNQLPADVTHIRLALGSQDLHFDLIGLIGKIGIRIIATDPPLESPP